MHTDKNKARRQKKITDHAWQQKFILHATKNGGVHIIIEEQVCRLGTWHPALGVPVMKKDCAPCGSGYTLAAPTRQQHGDAAVALHVVVSNVQSPTNGAA